MNRRTKATAIPQSVKKKVYERDNCRCVLCHRWAEPAWACAHYIRRSQGGLGVEKNILTLCPACHLAFDEGPDRQRLRAYLSEYLSGCYTEWSEEELRYSKWTEAQPDGSPNGREPSGN